MSQQLSSTAGHMAFLLVPVLLMAGLAMDLPWLAFAVVMFILPFARPLFRPLRAGESHEWSERIATFLELLPIAYAFILTAAIGVLLWHLAHAGTVSVGQATWLGLSLWTTTLFATCVAHELIHRRSAPQSLAGHYIAGIAGYPLLGHEHVRHHARPGDTASGEWPRVDDSVWGFSIRRMVRVCREAYGPSTAFWNRRAAGRHVVGLRFATAVAVATGVLFVLAGGWTGIAIYAGAALGLAFAMQLFTYVQHWGLGDDRQGPRAAQGCGWEDDCRLQSWMTLSFSVHHAHHQESHRTYYRAALAEDSPRLPAGYGVLMAFCMFPGLWRKVMMPALVHWERHPHDPRSPGRNLTCFTLYEERQAAGGH